MAISKTTKISKIHLKMLPHVKLQTLADFSIYSGFEFQIKYLKHSYNLNPGRGPSFGKRY